MELLKMVDEYKGLLDRKDQLKEETTENNKAIEKLRNELAQVMIDEECPKISRNGFLYSLQEKVRYNKKECDEDGFFSTLEDFGLADIIKRTVNANTLSGAMSNLVGEHEGILPEDFNDYINIYEFYDVRKQKETNKAAKGAKAKGA